MPLQGSANVERLCQLTQVSRAGFYRYLRNGWPAEEDVNLQSAIQDVVLEHRWRYGYRRVTAQLRQCGMVVNHKRVARIMREDNLLTVRREPASAASHEGVGGVQIYLNLPRRMGLTDPNQLWIADITYIRLRTEFVYLAVILDAFSRIVVGWALGRTLQAKLPLHALKNAIASRQRPPGVVHHSDQGVQYVCRDYMQALHEHQMVPSMSRPANPYDNATCESFLRTLKREEINANTYRDFAQLEQGVREFIEQYYNRLRLHSALSYQSPEEFEKRATQRRSEATRSGPMVTFLGT
jgi:transposase InsO family protein